MSRHSSVVLSFLLLLLSGYSVAAEAPSSPALTVDQERVERWNAFANKLVMLHENQLARYETRMEARTGGYAGRPQFYIERSYFEVGSDRLLSILQLERANPDNLHSANVYVYDDEGRVRVEYFTAYLPDYHNAPIQTLIFLYAYSDGLTAFRQFDASGERLYEQCYGTYNGEELFLSVEEEEFPGRDDLAGDTPWIRLYRRCFDNLPLEVGEHIDPLVHLR